MEIMKLNIPAILVLLMTALACAAEPPYLAQHSSVTPTRSLPVGVGDLAPDFTLQYQLGRKVTLSSARGKRPVVLVFYRGYW